MELIGTIARLGVQQAALKAGQKPRRWYDPAPLRAVPCLRLTPDGVVGHTEAGEAIVDVHHRAHPASRNRGHNGVSIGFTAHYDRMRRRFGPHLADGVAGENLLVRTDRAIEEAALREGLLVETDPERGGEVWLERVAVAEPCVEFTRYALRLPPDTPSDEAVAQALQFLRHGTRGYYAVYAGPPATLRLGDRVYLPS